MIRRLSLLAVRIVGMTHGLLFITYCFALRTVFLERDWSLRRGAYGFVAAFLPFGTFAFDRSVRRWEAEVVSREE